MNVSHARWLWLSQVITGILLIVLLGLHWVAQHYIAAGGLRNFAEIVNYLQNPLVLVLELLFLATVTYHALSGLRAILIDLGISPQISRFVNMALIAVGFFTILYGIDLTIDILKWN